MHPGYFFYFYFLNECGFFLCSLALSPTCRQFFTELLENCFQGKDFQKTPFYCCVWTGNRGFGAFSIVILTLYSSLIFTTNELHCQSPHSTPSRAVPLLLFFCRSCNKTVPFLLVSRLLIGQPVLWGYIGTPWFPMRSSICVSINSHLRWVAFTCTNGLKTSAGGSNFHSSYRIRRREHVNVAGSRWAQGRERKKGDTASCNRGL